MGVLGLWQILDSIGHPIKVEGLEGKRLGVDANVWLYKFIRGFREKDNATSIDSHKLGLFNRVSKLLFYKIKPVFVFDGPAPILKRKTLERRQNIRHKHLTKVQDAAMKAIATHLEKLKEQYPDLDIGKIPIKLPEFESNSLVAAEKLTDEDRDLFYLPPDKRDFKADSSSSDSDSDIVEIKVEKYRNDDPAAQYMHEAAVDIHSRDFEELPAEVRYEILHDIKQSRRRIINAESLPDDAGSFSNYQLERLKARRLIQQKIEKCEKDICSTYTGEFSDGRSIQAFRMQSDATSTMILRNNINLEDKSDQKEFKSDSLVASEKLTGDDSDLFYLPPDKKDIKADSSSSDTDSDLIEVTVENYSDDIPAAQYVHEAAADIHSRDSEKQPDEVSIEILNDIERSQRRIVDDQSLSDDADSISNHQADRLQAHRPIQQEIEKCEKDIYSTHTGESSDDRSIQAFRMQSDATSTMISRNNINPEDKSDQKEFKSDSLVASEKLTGDDSDLFYLPPDKRDSNADSGSSDSDSDIVEIKVGNYHKDDPAAREAAVDIHSRDSEKQPAEVSIEILHDIEQSQRRIVGAQSLQDDTDSVSNHQPDRLQAHRPIQQEVEKCEKDICSTHTGEESSQYATASQLNDLGSSARAHNKVTVRIIEEAKELLRLFGVPYIDAAGEAEAQCALLEELNLTEGTITDDSDIWLFGAQNVFRYFFSDDKYVTQYKMKDIEYHVRLNRENLVCFAMLVGSDYTDGIMNVGPVSALEILSEFSGEGLEPLTKFKEWRRQYKSAKDPEFKKLYSKKRAKLLRLQVPDEFPSRAVFEGYMKPMADSSTENFTWGTPELDELREYARRNFAWDDKKINEKLLPVMKKLNERKTQATIDTFFFKTAANRNPELFRSKRVNQALSKIGEKQDAGSSKAKTIDDGNVVNLSETDDNDDDDNDDERDKPSDKRSKTNDRKKKSTAANKKPNARSQPAKKAVRKRRRS